MQYIPPPWTAELLLYFLSGAQKNKPEGVKFELIYMVLPFIFDKVIRKCLISSNSTSTLNTIFFNKSSIELKNSLLDQNDRYSKFKDVTRRGLIYLGNSTELNINKYISVSNPLIYKRTSNAKKDYIKAAYQLGIILGKEEYLNIFLKFRITNL